MFLVVPLIMVFGITYGESLIKHIHLVPYLFAFVTISMAIGCSMKQVKEVLSRPLEITYFLIIIHVLAPILVYVLAGLVLGFHSPYVVGLVMFTLIPVGVSSVMWVSMTGGNLSLILAIVVIDSLISPFVITTGLKLFFSSVVDVPTAKMLRDLVLIVVLPTIAGIALNEWSKGTIKQRVNHIVAPISKLCFIVVVLLNASAITPSLDELKNDIFHIIPISIAIIIISYVLGYYSSMQKGSFPMRATLAYASGIRNISLGIVIAMSYFSPQTAVPVLIGVLLQQPLATCFSFALQKINKYTASQTS